MKIAVVGMGKIGLPLAVQYASKGHHVIGVDINPVTVDTINAGKEPFPGETELAARLADLVPAGKLCATTDYAAAIPQAQAVVIVVPLFVNDETWEPDLTIMDAATTAVGENLRPDTLVSYETTLPVGTTRNRFKPLLERLSGLHEGKDFWMVFSPERVLTGRVFADLRRYPKLVGGLHPEGTRRGLEFYRAVLDFDPRPDLPQPNGVWDMGSAEAAEMAKLAETTYRDVNIGLANQFARFADQAGIDVMRVIAACNSQPYSHIHRPGIAVGGHCIPVYPRLYLSTDPEATVVRAARVANAGMPAYVVACLAEALAARGATLEGSRVVVLGAAYRGGVKETAFSGVFPTVSELLARGAKVLVHDPMFNDAELADFGWEAYHWGQPVTAAVLQADHAEYRDLTAADLPGVKVVFDGRGVLNPAHFPGIPCLRVGGGDLSGNKDIAGVGLAQARLATDA